MEVPSLGGLPRVALTRDLACSASTSRGLGSSEVPRHAEDVEQRRRESNPRCTRSENPVAPNQQSNGAMDETATVAATSGSAHRSMVGTCTPGRT